MLKRFILWDMKTSGKGIEYIIGKLEKFPMLATYFRIVYIVVMTVDMAILDIVDIVDKRIGT